jgi:hypothetical protein
LFDAYRFQSQTKSTKKSLSSIMEPPLNNKNWCTNSEPRSTNNNKAIHPDKEDQIPTTAVFTWGIIVGHDLAASEVTVLVATQRGPQ